MSKFLQITLKKDEQHGPLYLQLASELIQLICRGVLKPGQMLPPSRELAPCLNVNRKTILKTYDELHTQGWVEIRERSGVYVSGNLPAPIVRTAKSKDKDVVESQRPGYSFINRPTGMFDENNASREPHHSDTPKLRYTLDDGFPDPRIVPVDEFAREFRRFGRSRLAEKFLRYGPEQGSYHLRVELANFLNRTRGMQVTEKEILITKGTQMGLYLTAQLLITPGDRVFVPEPGYHAANRTFLLAGAKLTYISVDNDGMDIDHVEQLCKRKLAPKLVYIIPHHHRPTTVTLCPERRMRLMSLAHQYKFAVLEDDYDFDYHFSGNPLLPLASVDRGRSVIYVGSFCKTISPGMRVGFMVAPEAVINEAAAIRKLIDRQGEQLLEEAMAELLRSGSIARHMKKSFKLYQERLENTCRLLQQHLGEYLTFERPNGGLAIWATYRKDISAKRVALNARKLGLQISDGSNYFFQPDIQEADKHVRIGYCSLNEEEMAAAIALWKQALIPFGLKEME